MSNGYAFGEGDLPAQRLELLAEVFETPSREFLEGAVADLPGVALDLGCGPGATTRMVAAATGARHTIGVDASDDFIARARSKAPPGVEFVRHDVTRLPLPGAPADLIYARLLLAHLPDPARHVAGWMTQLSTGGRLLVDENDVIEANHPALTRYEEIVSAVVGSRGAHLAAGAVVDALEGGDGWRRESSTGRDWLVPEPVAARMFAMNLATWRDHQHATQHYDGRELDRLAADLAAIANAPDDGNVRWRLRQVVFVRTS